METLNVPGNALEELNTYFSSRSAVSAATGIEENKITYAAFKGFSMLDKKQAEQLKNIAQNLAFTKEHLPEAETGQIVIKALENIREAENAQGYLNLVQLITEACSFSDVVFAKGTEQYTIVDDIMSVSHFMGHNASIMFGVYKAQKKELKDMIMEENVSNLRTIYGISKEKASAEYAKRAATYNKLTAEIVSNFKEFAKQNL